MSGELDGGTKESGGERVRGEDQYIVATQLIVPARGDGWAPGECRGCEQEKDQPSSDAPKRAHLTFAVQR